MQLSNTDVWTWYNVQSTSRQSRIGLRAYACTISVTRLNNYSQISGHALTTDRKYGDDGNMTSWIFAFKVHNCIAFVHVIGYIVCVISN